jgi:hypothetical protein
MLANQLFVRNYKAMLEKNRAADYEFLPGTYPGYDDDLRALQKNGTVGVAIEPTLIHAEVYTVLGIVQNALGYNDTD